MTDSKQQFIAELEPLLVSVERAINAGNAVEAQRLSIEIMMLAGRYASKLSHDDFRDAMNSPTANAIAKRLGLH